MKVQNLLVLLLIWSLSSFVTAQRDVSRIEISLLSCGPGDDMYSIFGHSALRVRNRATGQDLVYNWGLFDFDDPGFYTNFLMGKLNYKLGVQRFDSFIRSYERQKRTVVEQEIQIWDDQKSRLLDLLDENYKPQNRYYLYDFFFDNCSTRIRDLLVDRIGLKMLTRGVTPAKSFRDGLHAFNDRMPWAQFGMDLLVGARADQRMSEQNQMFLPQYLQENLTRYIIRKKRSTHRLLGSKNTHLNFDDLRQGKALPWPLIIFSLLFFSILAIQLFVRSKELHRRMDIVLFSILGLVGLLLSFMWWGTDHYSTKNNYNLLWANPLYLLLIYPLIRKYHLRWVYIFILISTVLLIVGWKWLPQDLHVASLPIIGIVALRALYNIKHSKSRIRMGQN